MKLYTVVVHNLQMCMKEYRCCLKFRRGDNSTYTFTKRGVGMYLVIAYKVHALLLFVKVQVELSPLPNFGQRPHFFMHICR
jgi:hypothetical protein